MELGKHLGKGLWGLADKALPVVYGVGYVLLVIRVLPEEEFGNFVLVQELFLIITGLGTSFALWPLLKFAAEERPDYRSIISGALWLNLGFLVAASGVVIVVRTPFSALLNSPGLEPLILYLPALLAASFVRNFTLILLQTRFKIQEVFWTDAAHFLGAPVLVLVYSWMGVFNSALDLVIINIISLLVSSVIGLLVSRSLIHLTLIPKADDLRALWDYGKYSLGSIVSYLFYSKADSFILSAFTGPVHVGVYNSVKVFIRLYDMVAQVVQMFVLPATSRLASRGEFTTLKAFVEKSIAFTTVGTLPILVMFLFLATPLVSIYGGKYDDAIPMLQVFASLTFLVPLIAVGSNVLMGLGQTRDTFVLGIQNLLASIACYLVLIPLLGGLGASLGYVMSSIYFAWITGRRMNKHVPVTFREVARRGDDIKTFLVSRISRYRVFE